MWVSFCTKIRHFLTFNLKERSKGKQKLLLQRSKTLCFLVNLVKWLRMILQRELMKCLKLVWEWFEWYSVCWGSSENSTCDLIQCVWFYLKQITKHSHNIWPAEKNVQIIAATSSDIKGTRFCLGDQLDECSQLFGCS